MPVKKDWTLGIGAASVYAVPRMLGFEPQRLRLMRVDTEGDPSERPQGLPRWTCVPPVASVSGNKTGRCRQIGQRAFRSQRLSASSALPKAVFATRKSNPARVRGTTSRVSLG